MRLVLTDASRADLMSISEYSLAEWGASGKKRYMRAIRTRFSALLRHPELGPAREDLGPGCRCLLAGRHAIFYRLAGEELIIQRILHQRMDAAQHIAGA